MKYKTIISLIAIIFSLSSGFVFATPLPEIYDENELMSYTSSNGGLYVRTGLIFNAFDYDETGKLYIEFKKSNNANNITDWSYFSGYSKDYFYFPNYNHPSMTTILLRQVSNPSNTLPLRLHYCSSYVNSLPWNWSMCQYSYSDLQSGAIRVYPYVLGSYTSPNGQYLTKTLIDNYYGTDFLEGNYYFEGVEVWYLNSSSTRNSNLFYVINSELTEFGYDVAYNTFPMDSPVPPVVNGTCGDASSVDNWTYEEPSEDLCDTGTPTEVLVTNFSDYYWTWDCEGSGGGTSETCYSHRSMHPINTITATCGSSHTETFEDPPTSDLCDVGTPSTMTYSPSSARFLWKCVISSYDYINCYANSETLINATCADNDTITDITDIYQRCETGYAGVLTLSSNGLLYTWTCYGQNGGTDASCQMTNANSIVPPDNDNISGLSTTISNIIKSIATWLFVPSPEAYSHVLLIYENLRTKYPFGYYFDILKIIEQLEVPEADEYEVTVPQLVVNEAGQLVPSETLTMSIFKISTFKNMLGTTFWNIYWSILKALIWIYFAVFVFSRIRIMLFDTLTDNDKK